MNGYNPMIDYRRNELMAQQAMIQQQLAQLNQAQMISQPQMQQPTALPPQTRYYAKEENSNQLLEMASNMAAERGKSLKELATEYGLPM